MIATKKVAKCSETPTETIASWRMLAASVASNANAKAFEDQGLSLRRKSAPFRTGTLRILLKI
jgi:hypothetical protein